MGEGVGGVLNWGGEGVSGLRRGERGGEGRGETDIMDVG